MRIASLLYAGLMVAVIVAMDLTVFRNRLWERLIANVAVVLAFAAVYLLFLHRR